MKFDFEGARKAGLSDSEIVQYLSTLPNNGNLNALKEMGASDSHIIDLWSGSKNFSIKNPQESQTQKNNLSPTEQSKIEQPQIEQPKDVKSLFESINPTEEKLPPIENTLSEDGNPKTQNPDFSNNTIPSQAQSIVPQTTQTQQEPPKPENSFSGTLVDILDDGLGISLSEQRAKKRQKRNEYLAEKIATSDAKNYNDLDDEEKNFIRNKYNEKNSILGIRNPFAMLDKNEDKFQSVKKDLQKEHQIKQILDSDLSYDDLTLEQKQLINDKTSIFKKFSKPQEVFEDLKSEYQIHKIAPTIEKSISELNNISANKRLYNIFNSDPSIRDKYLQDVYNIATNAGFDNVSVDTARHKMYLLKDEKAYEVEDGFLDSIWDDIKSSKFELGASLAGAVAGSKFGPTPQTKLLGGIIGGALGAIGGSGLDYQINSWLLKRKKDSDELLGKMLEAGALSVVGDVATLGAIKLVKSGYNSLKKIPAYANELRENFTSQNINGAMKLLEDVGISKSQAESVAKKMDQYVETRFVADKEDSFLDKALSKVSKINDSVRQKEKIAFDVAYADPILWKYIGAVAKNEPKFSNFIHNSITQRAKKISLDPEVKLGDIQEAIKEYEQSLTSQYGEAIDLLDTALPNYRFYPQEFLENKLSKIAEHIGENKSEGIIAGLNNQIKDMGEGLNVSQMIDIRKLINKTLRRNARFDYNDIGALKDINSYIDSNIEEALLKNAKSEPKLEVLYDEWKKINAKYRDYKELQESKLYKDIFSDNYNNDEKLGNAFINWSKTDERLTDSIIGRLDPRMQDKTQAFILAKSIDKHIQDTLNDGKVVDFLELKKTLSHLEDKITNKSLKDHIDILKDMADLFYNDINLMRESGQINILTPNSGSGISHDLIARAHTSTISNIYRTIQRFLPTTAGKNSAFLYHLGKAMNMSRNSKELIFDLVSSPDTPPSLLKELRPAIEAYNGRVGNAIDNVQEIQTQKDQQNYLDMLESSEKYEKERIQNDTISDSQALERMETPGVSDVGSTGEQAIPHRGDTEGLLLDSGKIRATNGNRDGEFGRVSGNDEGGDRPLRSSTDGRRDEGARTTGKIPQEPQEIRETNKSTTGTSRGRLEAKQTPESTTITQEGLPPSPSLNELAKSLKKTKDPLENITDFGTNYPEYYHDGKGAIEKLLQTKEGQVQGAFYRPDIGDITLVWGKEGTGKSDGFGLSKIVKFHPEVIDKLDELINTLPITKESPNRYQLENEKYKLAIRKEYEGDKENWILTAFEKDGNSVSSRTDFRNAHTQATDKATSVRAKSDSTTEKLKNQNPLENITDFGTNYPEFYHDGKGAIEKLLQEKQGQVQGAFYKEGLGDIDLVWGEVTNAEKHTGYGLAHIIDKHPEITPEKLENIITEGKATIRNNEAVKIEKDGYKVVLKGNWKGEPTNNKWVVTAYENKKEAPSISSDANHIEESLSKTSSDNLTQEQLKNQLDEFDDFIQKRLPLEPMLTEEEVNTLYNKILLDWLKEHPNMDTDFVMMYDHYLKNKMINKTPAGFTRKGKELSSLSLDKFNHYKDKILSKKLPKQELETITDFGTNYPEYYHDGKGAIEKLLQTREGQVQGAFYKEGLGDIDLVWGNEKMGLAHILEKHPEVIEKIPEIINDGELIVKKYNATQILKDDYKVVLKSNLYGEPTENKWILTAYEDVRGKDKFIDSTPVNSKETLSETSVSKSYHRKTEKSKKIPLKSLVDKQNQIQQDLQKLKTDFDKKEYNNALETYGIKDIEDSLNAKDYLKSDKELFEYFQLKKSLNHIKDLLASRLRKNSSEEIQEATKIQNEIKEAYNHYRDYTTSILGIHSPKYMIDMLKAKVKEPLFKLNEEEKEILTHFYKEGRSGFEDFNPPFKINQKELLQTYQNLKDKYDNFSADVFYNEMFGERGDKKISSISKRYDELLRSIKKSIQTKEHAGGGNFNSEDLELYKKHLKMLEDKEVENFIKNSNYDVLDYLKELDWLQKRIKEGGYPSGWTESSEKRIEELENKLFKNPLQTKEVGSDGTFYREEIGDIHLSEQILDKIKRDYGTIGVEKLPDIINNGELFRKIENGDLFAYKDGFLLKMDNERNIHYIMKIGPNDNLLKHLEPISTLQKSTPQELNQKDISHQLSNSFKEAYNKYEGTKSTEYQQTKEIEKSDLATGITANVYTKVADEIMDRSSLELALHNNWVKETIKDPFGINFKKSTFSTIRGKEALETLLTYKLGQVKGAFHKEGLGDIDLVWGDSKMGLAHILEKHPEVIEKIPEIIEKGEVIKNGEFETIVLKNNELYKVGLSKGWNGNGENHWILTAYEDTRLPHSDLLPSNGVTSRDVLPSNNLETNPTTEQLKNQELNLEEISDKLYGVFKRYYNEFKITKTPEYQNEKGIYEYTTNPLKKGLLKVNDADDFLSSNNPLKIKQYDNYVKKKLKEPFGINFILRGTTPKGQEAILTLLNYKLGQVKGAFYKEGLGDIDLVWGDSKMGLAHILEKHPEVIQKIPEIIEKGEVIKNGRFETIVFEDNGTYKVGLSKGWHDKGDNSWIITAYEDTRLLHSDALPSNGVASRDVLPSNNLETNPTTEQLKNQELLHTYEQLEKKYPEYLFDIYENYISKKLEGGNPYYKLKEILKTKKTEKTKIILNMLNDPEIEKFIKSVNDGVMEVIELKNRIKSIEEDLENAKQNPIIRKEFFEFEEERLQKFKKIYKKRMKEIFGKSPIEEESKEDLIKEAFSEFSSQGTLSETTKQALEKSGSKVETEGENILIHHPVERSDKDLEPLNTPSTPEAIITPSGYTQYDGLGNIIKEISITPDTLSSIEKQGNITTTETLDLTTNKSTKQVEVTNPEVLVPITSPSSSSAPSSSIIAKLKDDFKIDPNATLSKSPKKRFDNNIEAIRILKKLEENKTLPTLEEKQKLSLYVGWGGLSNSFKDNSPEDKLLKELLSEEEYIRARNSTLSSYYTPYFVVDSMYKALQNMGFSGGEILEPSVGVGNFFGLLPDSLRHTSNLRGIELDNTTAKIAKYLYPSAKIEHTGYENALLSKNNYDLVIGNPPYGSFSVYDKNFKKESKHNIHNYFMLKNLALTKEDGILAQIITTNFLDTKNPEVRELIAKEAEFLGAIRLPQGSFDDTQVATDIVFFKKLKRGETASSKEWVNLKSIPDSQGKEDIPINSYFVNNPQYMLGTPGRYGGMYGADTVGFRSNGNTQVQLQKVIEELTEGIHIDTRPILASSTIAQKTIDNLQAKPVDDLLHSSYIRPGGIALDSKSKEIYRLNQNEELEKVPDLELIDKTQEEFDKLTEIGKKAKLAQIKRIKEMIPAISEIRDTLMHLKRLQLDPMADEASIGTQRKKLNTLYDDFRNTFHTFLSDSKIAKAFDGDPTYPHIAALEEDYKRVDKKYQAKKADIFTKRTQFPYVNPTKAKDIEDGIFISYNQTGRLDFDTIASLLDKDSESVKKEMLDKNLAFKDNEGNIIYAPEFLSGDIKAKIKSFEEKELDEYQNKALNALLKVVPPKVEIEGIGINMGANYIPIEIYQDFAKEVLGGGERAVSYQKLTDKFIVNFKSSIEADKAFGVEGEYKSISASDVFDSALNDRKITMGIKEGENFYPDPKGQISLDQQIGAIKEAFKNFIYEDYKRAEKIENVYNDIFNNTKLREFDGSFLKLEGSSNLITLRPHQKNAIYRVISSPTTLLDHTVGTGKTYTMVGSAMELRRLGLAQKPLIVVPNHIVNQFGAEFARLYPDANILATRKFDKKSRQRTLSAITTGDWDAIIIGHSNFEMLPMSKQAEMNFINEQIATFEQAIKAEKIENTGSSLSVKKLESALESKKRKLNELMDAKRDETIHFEDLGIDALFLDEAHEFKNLEFFSKQNISGLGSQKGSKKAFDLFMKTRYLRDKNKKIIFATGTPISNSIAELYTLQKYLDFEGLEKKGINSFDQWSKTFGKVETRFEYHPKGDFKLTNRFAGYINMPELIKEYKKFSDVIVNEDVEAMLKLQGKEFDLPKADFITATIKKSPRQESFMQEIMERSQQIDGGIDPAKDNYLKVTTDGKKGSLDMRLIDPLYEDNPDSKVNTSIANIIKEYNKWKQDKGTQLVFLDMSTPKNKNPKAKKELDELLKRIEQGDEEAEEILRAKGGSDYIKIINNDGFSVYEDIRDKLIKEGIPEKEIAFIHDFDTDKKKAELFTKVNDGEVRILLGSTSKMGAGTNVQERIVAIHHLDAPWRPADIEQRNGRGIRQGNSLYEKYGKDKFKVNIYTYVTKGMLDTMIFEKLHTKAKFISQLRKGDLSGREIEDIGDEVLNFAEIQAATLEDRRYLEVLELKRDIDSLTALQKNIANINLRTTREINALEYEVKNKPKEIQTFKSDMEHFNKAGNKVQIGNTTYIKGEKNNGLSEALEGIRIDRDIQSIYKYNDFIIEVSVSKRNYDFGYVDLIAHSPNTEESYLISTTKKQDFKPNGALTKIDNYFKAQRLLAMQNELKNAQIALPKLKNSLKKFDKQKELEEKTKRHIKLIEDLRVKLNSHPYVGLGLFGAISGGEIDYNQDGKNDEADMLLGALGAIIGGRGLKYLLSKNSSALKNVLLHYFPDKKEEINTAFKKEVQKEKRGIYNVAYNDKLATMIRKDLDSVEKVIKLEKGTHDKKRKKGFGVTHINARHINSKDLGYITQEEYLKLGDNIRTYLKEYKKPHIDRNGSRIYEWKDGEGTSFRVVVGNTSKDVSTLETRNSRLSSPAERIITFYSDRNFKQKMKFKNPNLRHRGITLW